MIGAPWKWGAPRVCATDKRESGERMKNERAARPIHKTGLFQNNKYSYERASVIEWQWSDTFGKWGAVVEFENGERTFTWEKPKSA